MKQRPPTTDFPSQLRSLSLKVTPSRLAVLTVLSRSAKPLTVEGILKRIMSHSSDLATVYRVLSTFRAKGIVRHVDFEHGHAHFELTSITEHHHLICTSCGRVEDVIGCNIQKEYSGVLKKLPMFQTIDHHQLEMFGICRACVKRK